VEPVAIHGRAAAHDHVTGQAGSHAAAVARLLAAGAPREVATLVVRSNFRELTALPPWLRAHEVTSWSLTFPGAGGRFAADPRPWIPRYGMALPHALMAIDQARRLGIEATIAGVPACLLGPHADWRRDEPPRAFAPRCDGCARRSDCAGVDAWYLERFGAGELRAQ